MGPEFVAGGRCSLPGYLADDKSNYAHIFNGNRDARTICDKLGIGVAFMVFFALLAGG